MIFTDGSICDGTVKNDACLAILSQVSDDQEVQVRTVALGCRVSTSECEVEAIILGISVAIQHHQTLGITC